MNRINIYREIDSVDIDIYGNNPEKVQKIIDFLEKNKNNKINLDGWGDNEGLNDMKFVVSEYSLETDEEYRWRLEGLIRQSNFKIQQIKSFDENAEFEKQKEILNELNKLQ